MGEYMKLKIVLKTVQGQIINGANENQKIRKIQIDSRKVSKNDLFIAIQGKNFDGHDFIEDAIKNGANAIICEKNIDIKTNVPIIKVESTVSALGALALYNRMKYRDVKVIGITGSNGKTTTKELISLILSKNYRVLKSEKSFNNNLGIPQTLLEINDNYDFVVLEMGMNHEGEIDYLSNISLPDYGIITNIGSAHIGYLKSKRNILRAKCEIINGMNRGTLFVNGCDKYLKRIKIKDNELIKVVNRAENVCCDIDKTSFDYKDEHFIFNVPGKHLLMDVILAIEVCLHLNVPIDKIKEAILEYKTLEGRVNVIKKDNITIIDDSYNSNYESLVGSLDLLEKGYNIVVLGDILELGDKSVRIHKRINKYIKKKPISEVLLIGDYTKYIKGKHFENIGELTDYLNSIIKPNCTVLIKGSALMNLKDLKDKIKVSVF